jgi:hypothetical protein
LARLCELIFRMKQRSGPEKLKRPLASARSTAVGPAGISNEAKDTNTVPIASPVGRSRLPLTCLPFLKAVKVAPVLNRQLVGTGSELRLSTRGIDGQWSRDTTT